MFERDGVMKQISLHAAASSDSESMTILGYKYYPESDSLSLNLGEVNFNRKVRGAKPPNLVPCTSTESIESIVPSRRI